MSITDELRKYARGYKPMVDHTLLEIADRIDAEYESSYKDGYDEGAADILAFYDGLKESAQGREDVTLWGVEYVARPLDVDGESWHVGDEIANQYNHLLTVSEIIYKGNGRWMLHAEPNWNFYADIACHHHPRTVEDVLEEFAQMYIACNDKGTIAEYAKRLRLAGEDE